MVDDLLKCIAGCARPGDCPVCSIERFHDPEGAERERLAEMIDRNIAAAAMGA